MIRNIVMTLAGAVAFVISVSCSEAEDANPSNAKDDQREGEVPTDASNAGGDESEGGAAIDSGVNEGEDDSGPDAEVRPMLTFADYSEGRYCEVLIARTENENELIADVWNSLAFGSCPQEQWEALDAEEIKNDFPDAVMVMLNGPRFWVLQEISDNGPPRTREIHTFGEITMFLAATLRIADPTQAQPYNESLVDRDTTYRFTKSNRVFELRDPEGKTYVMQSFSRIVDVDLTFDELIDLGERLSLPDGWRFDTRILEEDLVVVATGVATVIQDELKNTYQLIE